MDRYEAQVKKASTILIQKSARAMAQPRGTSQRLLNGGGAQSTLPTQSSISSTVLAAAVPGATQTPQTPATRPSAPATPQLSLEDMESQHQGGQTAAEVRAREKVDQAALRREKREVDDYNLRQWEAITRANATITDQLNNLEMDG